MLLAVDLGLDKAFRFQGYREELSLPEDIRILEDVGGAGPLEEDRVIYITSLDDGGLKYQRDFLRDHPGVGEWLVFSDGTPEYLLEQFRNGVVGTVGKVFLFSTLEELRNALERPCSRKKSCLLCACNTRVDTGELEALMRQDLAGWTVERVCLTDEPGILEHNTCSHVLLVGERRSDFLLPVEIPTHVEPILVLTQAEKNIHLELEHLRRDVFGSLRGLDWGRERQRQNFYLVSTLYEGLRRENDGVEALRRDERFVMWDSFGLPLPIHAYTQEAIHGFLEQFDGCARLAARLCQDTNSRETGVNGID